MNDCPLCLSSNTSEFHYHHKHSRMFYICDQCDLKFIARDSLISRESEKGRYELHQNNKRTKGYDQFLYRLIDPVKKRVSIASKGLDFGEGPYPMLAYA